MHARTIAEERARNYPHASTISERYVALWIYGIL